MTRFMYTKGWKGQLYLLAVAAAIAAVVWAWGAWG